MDDEKWPALPPDPGWVLEQIELGARQAGVPLQSPPSVPKLSNGEIKSAVTRLLDEELARLEAPQGAPEEARDALGIQEILGIPENTDS